MIDQVLTREVQDWGSFGDSHLVFGPWSPGFKIHVRATRWSRVTESDCTQPRGLYYTVSLCRLDWSKAAPLCERPSVSAIRLKFLDGC